MKTKECSVYLKENKEAIFQEWETLANREMEAAFRTPDLIVRNYLPFFMENLVETLDQFDGIENEKEFSGLNFNAKISHEHGRSRASVAHYDLRQVVREYSVLRQVIRNRLLENELLCFTTLEIIDRFVEASSMEAGQYFMDSISDIQDKLIGVIAHDLRNPISVSLSYIEVGELGLLPQDSVYAALKRSLTRSVSLIQDLLDTTQVKAGSGMTFRFERVDLLKYIRAAIKEATEVYSNNVQFHTEMDAVEGIFDHTSIHRAVENLISNGIKYGSINTPIQVTMSGDKHNIVIAVHNMGSYIEKEMQEKIFNYLSRDANKDKSQQLGWGLGLFLVKMVANAHKGKAWVESDKEQGTKFFIELDRFAHDENTTFSHVM